MNPEFEKIEALLPDFQYVDSDHDRIVLTVGFTASFYFWNGHEAATREGLVRCFEAFEKAFGEHLAWRLDGDEARWVKYSGDKKKSIRQYVTLQDEDDCIEWHLTSSEDPDGLGEYFAFCLTERGWMEGECSSFRFQLPRSLVFDAEGKKAVLDLVSFCVEQLEPYHANAGLTSISVHEEMIWEAEKLDEATRYMTLYTDDKGLDIMQAPRGIKGVNWLTFVSNTLTECLGGPVPFADYCRRFGVEPIALGNGFMIQAGELPQIGPVGFPVPEAYVRANGALRPLRNGNFGSMGSGSISGEVRFDCCTSDLWIRRLDALGIWPPKTLIGLPDVPLGAAPRKKIKLKPGDVCTVHGRYRKAGFVTPPDYGDDENLAPMVVLLPGDVAPFILKLGDHGEFLGRSNSKWELIAEL
ncbi:type VI immunity family protein [Massilia sp. TWP1-3-3]|uniref:type VI immunity family protein n=1 Tax=Massilia sp. TWP1-3-3 TaxID=2804573 RepID=UPI003CEB82DE